MSKDQKKSQAKGKNSDGNSASAVAAAQANLTQSISDALALASLNAVQAQQQTNILHQTATVLGTAQMHASLLGIRQWAGIAYGKHLGIPVPDENPVNPSRDVAQALKDMEAISEFFKDTNSENPA